jgi:hypothetical protein
MNNERKKKELLMKESLFNELLRLDSCHFGDDDFNEELKKSHFKNIVIKEEKPISWSRLQTSIKCNKLKCPKSIHKQSFFNSRKFRVKTLKITFKFHRNNNNNNSMKSSGIFLSKRGNLEHAKPSTHRDSASSMREIMYFMIFTLCMCLQLQI